MANRAGELHGLLADGAVQLIHRVRHAEVVTHLAERWSYMRTDPAAARPHAVYQLSPQLPPTEPILTDHNYRAVRLGCSWSSCRRRQLWPERSPAPKRRRQPEGCRRMFMSAPNLLRRLADIGQQQLHLEDAIAG